MTSALGALKPQLLNERRDVRQDWGHGRRAAADALT
jgi:hypothetical protein